MTYSLAIPAAVSCACPRRAWHLSLPVLLSTPFIVVPVWAQDSKPIDQALPLVVVTATRTPQPVTSVLSATTLIGADDVEHQLSGDAAQLLAAQGAVEIARTGGLGSQASIFMRGANSNQTLVLIDGVPINNLNFGLPSVSFLPMGQIDHIEVVRGNVSSLYGSNAIGGVIQVFSKAPAAGWHPSASVTVGSDQLAEASVGLSGGNKSVRVGFTLDQLHSAGINDTNQSERPGTNPDRDGYLNHSFSGRVDWTLDRGHIWSLTHFNTWGLQHYDSEFGPATQPDVSRFRVQQTTLLGRDQWTPVWSSQLRVSRMEDALDASVTAYPYFVNTVSDQIEWSHVLVPRPGQEFSAGLERNRSRLSSDTVYDRSSRTVDSVRAGYLDQWGDWQLQTNVRNDHTSDFGSATTGLLGLGWSMTPSWKWIATYSTGFRAPTFNDLFYPGYSNPALHPEHAHSGEFGLQYAQHGWRVRSTIFRANYRDLIELDSSYIPQNIGRAHVDGWETTWSGSWMGLEPSGSLTVQNARDDTVQSRLPRRAHVFGALGLKGEVLSWAWFVQWLGVGNRVDTAGQSLGGYGLVDVGLSRALSPDLTVRVSFNNVGDKRYETAYGYNQPGREAFVRLNWNR